MSCPPKWAFLPLSYLTKILYVFFLSYVLLYVTTNVSWPSPVRKFHHPKFRRSQWPHRLRLRPATARLLRLWVPIPPGAWMFVCCECCVLSGWGLWIGLITRPGESYRLWCVVVCDLETSSIGRPWRTLGQQRHGGGGDYHTKTIIRWACCVI